MAHELTHVVQQKQNLLNRKNKLDMIRNKHKKEAVLASTRIPYNHLNSGNNLVTADTTRTGIRRTEDKNSLVKKYKETYNLVLETIFDIFPVYGIGYLLAFKMYRVKIGAWLSKIAMVEWGDPMLYQFLYSYDNEVEKAINSKGVLGLKTVMESRDPNLIYPGQLFYAAFKDNDFTKHIDLNKLNDSVHPTASLTIGSSAPLPRNPHIASDSLCRGACGPDCPPTCTAQPNVHLCVPDSTGSCHYIDTYKEVIECGSHRGCREHDNCYDQCAADGGGIIDLLPINVRLHQKSLN